MIRVCLFAFILLMQLSTIITEGCDSFNNTTIYAQDIHGENLSFVVNGCIEPNKELKGDEIRDVLIDSDITRLGKDSIRNLPKLEWMGILENNLEILESHAFRNMPSLKSLNIFGTNLREIPKDVFNSVPTITTLVLSNNKIDFIASGAFSNMDSIEVIKLRFNQLTYWNRDWFENCPNLYHIDFSDNKISIIPRRAFASLPMLKAIDLGENKITTIQADAFRNMTNLIYLNLELNRLTVLDERAFPNKIYIENLSINNNRLNYLPDKLLSKLSIGTINLDQNPWKCPCMLRINDWLFFTRGSVEVSEHPCRTSNDPVCIVPQGNTCKETVEVELTGRYLGNMRNLIESINNRFQDKDYYFRSRRVTGELCISFFS
ncbi:unnamed protein product [Phaedon cochleariae]|uniref:Uncharacterized protein n=1 Tax=Phaedon cochleariae TaxID=80249 RepID=A0A9N9SFW7_PHACE|nr:unnamed protein product [Phaedon cochleariae]